MSTQISIKHLNIPKKNKVIDYWPAWLDWSRKSLEAYLNNGPKSRVDIINIAFALPQQNGTLLWNDVDKSEYGNYKKTLETVQKLQSQGKLVTIAVGGATAQNWDLSSPEKINILADNIKKFVDEYGLNGVDIDYEITEPSLREKVADLIIELRKRMPANQYLITYAAWSIGAYGKANPPHLHPEWAVGNEGIDISILKKVGHLLDWVNVMSYDAFDPNIKYNPIEAIEAYKSLMGSADKVVLGIELGPQGWPKDIKKTTKDAKPWIEYAASNEFGGVMFWTLEYDSAPNKRTDEPDHAFLTLADKIMPRTVVQNSPDLKHTAEANQSKPPSATATAAAPISTANSQTSNIKQNNEPKLPPALHLQYDAQKPIVSQDNTVNLDIADLNEVNRKFVLETKRLQDNELNKLTQQYNRVQEDQAAQLKVLTIPQQIEGLKSQYILQNQQLEEHLKQVKNTFHEQLIYLIQQLRTAEKNTRLTNK